MKCSLLLLMLFSVACSADSGPPMVSGPDDDGGTSQMDDVGSQPDATVEADADVDTPPLPDMSVEPDMPSGTCGDGQVDRFVEADGWYREECDEGAANGSEFAACTSDCRFRRCDEGRACGPFRSTFAAYMPSDDAEIRSYYLKMRRDGFEEVIFVNVGGQEWTKSGSSWSASGEQISFMDDSQGPSALQRHLDVATEAGVSVVVGLGGIIPSGGFEWEVWLNSAVRGPFVDWNLDLAADIVDQVGSSPAFGGLYLSQEMNLGDAAQCNGAGDYYAEMIAGVRGRQGLRALVGANDVTVAPYLAVGGESPTNVGQTFRCLFDKMQAAGGIDRILVQDGVPKEAEGFTSLQNVGDHFEAMRAALPAASREVLWVDLETYAWPDGDCFLSRPADIDRIAGQVREIGRHVNGFSQWIHAHNFTAAGLGLDECDGARAALGAAYREQPFPFHVFLFQGNVIMRGYRLEPGGTGGLRCQTSSGMQTFEFTQADGMSVIYAPDFVSDDDVPDPDEIFEVSFSGPGECTGNRVAYYINPDGVTSAAMPF